MVIDSKLEPAGRNLLVVLRYFILYARGLRANKSLLIELILVDIPSHHSEAKIKWQSEDPVGKVSWVLCHSDSYSHSS